MKKIYFDYASTTPVDSKVINAMKPYYSGVFGNPGSIHRFGQEASAALFKSRNNLAKLIGCDYREVIFTGSATEANNLAIRGVIKNFNQKSKEIPRIITSQIEHESILETCRDIEREGLAEVVYLPVSKSGMVDLKKIKASLNKRTVLVSIIYANNEIGSIQPIAEITKIICNFKNSKTQNSKNKILGLEDPYPLFHTDAVQSFNYLDCDVKELRVDMMSLSSQKIYGPKGVGCLYVKNFGGFRGNKFISPIITGGWQEEGLRSGTENVSGIVGFSKAAEIAFKLRESENKRLKKLQEYFWKNIKKRFSSGGRARAVLNGSKIGIDRLSNNINIYFSKRKDLIFKLDLAGFAVSGGSACSARLAKPSHVLKAIGCNVEKSSESIRISFGRQITKQEVDKLLKAISNFYKD
jgi:cysteine desulfurase